MNDTKSGTQFFYCMKCIEVFEADHQVCRKNVFTLQSLPREGVSVKIWQNQCLRKTIKVVRNKEIENYNS